MSTKLTQGAVNRIAEIEGNRARDARTTAALEAQGWTVLTVWECSIRPEALEELAFRIKAVEGGGRRGTRTRTPEGSRF